LSVLFARSSSFNCSTRINKVKLVSTYPTCFPLVSPYPIFYGGPQIPGLFPQPYSPNSFPIHLPPAARERLSTIKFSIFSSHDKRSTRKWRRWRTTLTERLPSQLAKIVRRRRLLSGAEMKSVQSSAMPVACSLNCMEDLGR
jgi:hypothetical protein